MGYIAHDAVIVTVSDYANERDFAPGPKVKAFRESLPEEWRPLVIGPVRSVVNGYDTYAFLPDGSKEGWRDSDQGDEYRSQFEAIFTFRYEDGSSPFDVVKVCFGGDERMEFDEPRASYPDARTLPARNGHE